MSAEVQSAVTVATPKADDARRINPLALAGVALGVISYAPYLAARGLTPVLGIIFSTWALAAFDENTEKMRWMAAFGLGLSVLYILVLYPYTLFGMNN